MQIDAKYYDGLRHIVPFAIGSDFVEKYSAFIGDGFFVSIGGPCGEQALQVFKAMPGDYEIPAIKERAQ